MCGWRRRESNPRPLPCDGSALPAELRPQASVYFSNSTPRVNAQSRIKSNHRAARPYASAKTAHSKGRKIATCADASTQVPS